MSIFRRKKNTHTCPRRAEITGPFWPEEQNKDDKDTWRKGVGLTGQRDQLSCSHCGSLHPVTFIEWIKNGYVLGPTDKTYKAYIGKPSEKPLTMQVPDGEGGFVEKEFLVGGQEAKFYYQHLSEEQRRQFIDLYNDGTMQIGYPGHLYVMPFFVKRGN